MYCMRDAHLFGFSKIFIRICPLCVPALLGISEPGVPNEALDPEERENVKGEWIERKYDRC